MFFQPDAKIDAAVAEVTAINQTAAAHHPAGDDAAADHPLLGLERPDPAAGAQSATLSEQQLSDYGLNFIRTQLATVQGAQVPLPYGGKSRQVMVDLDPDAALRQGALGLRRLRPRSTRQNVILPAGTAKIGPIEYNVRTNSSPDVARRR